MHAHVPQHSSSLLQRSVRLGLALNNPQGDKNVIGRLYQKLVFSIPQRDQKFSAEENPRC